MKKDELSLLLFLETQAVDHCGRVFGQSMNADDFETAKMWNKEGFIVFARLKLAEIRNDGRTHYVELSPRAWKAAHAERRAMAERMRVRQARKEQP